MSKLDRTPEPLILSTRTPKHLRDLIFTFTFVGEFSFLPPLLLGLSPRPIDADGAAALVLLVAIFLALPILLLFTYGPYLGIWTLASEGVTFRHADGRERALAWQDIERVRWIEGHILLTDGQTKIALPLGFFTKEERDAVRSRIEKALSADFNLRIKPIGEGPDFTQLGWRRGLTRFAQLCGIAVFAFVALAITCAALVLAIGPFLPDEVVILLPQAIMLAPLLWVGIREDRRRRRLNPNWRYRRLD